jgi:type II secretion system protein J
MKQTTYPTSGFTLIEFVVVLAVFSVISTMAIGILGGALRINDRLATTSEVSLSVVAAASLMRRDVEQMVAVSERLNSERSFSAVGNGMSFIVATSEGSAEAAETQLSEITWENADGNLTRRVRTIGSASASDVGRVKLLEGVSNWNLTAYVEPAISVPGVAWAPRALGDLPLGIDLRIDVEGFGPLRVVAAR